MRKKGPASREKTIKTTNSHNSSKNLSPVDIGKQSKGNSPRSALLPAKRSSKPSKTSKVPLKHSDSLSEDDSSMNSAELNDETKDMKEKILKSLAVFKNASKDYISNNALILEEFNSLQFSLEVVKNEVNQVFNETSQSKQEMVNIVKRICESPDKHETISTKMSPDPAFTACKEEFEDLMDDPQEKLTQLRKELNELKQIIEHNEDELRASENQSMDIKTIAEKLQISFTENTDDENLKKKSTCLFCSIV